MGVTTRQKCSLFQYDIRTHGKLRDQCHTYSCYPLLLFFILSDTFAALTDHYTLRRQHNTKGKEKKYRYYAANARYTTTSPP